MSLLHVHRVTTTPVRKVAACPTCKRRRRMRMDATGPESYYGPTFTCCGCGGQWADGEAMTSRGATRQRRENIAYAKKSWQ